VLLISKILILWRYVLSIGLILPAFFVNDLRLYVPEIGGGVLLALELDFEVTSHRV
jgi:hypothetical protein